MIEIRRIQPADWPHVLPLLRDAFAQGDTYAYASDSSDEEIQTRWLAPPNTPLWVTFVALADSGRVMGTYTIKPNQPGRGSHVCNGSYVVAKQDRGQGIATALCHHSQQEAIRLGFHAMQFNLVVSTNTIAVRLWQKLGFHQVGTLPRAFEHATHGYVDALVMYKLLVQPATSSP